MVRLRLLRWGFASLALIGARPVLAAPISFTGFVSSDFNPSNPNVHVTPVSDSPLVVGPDKWMTDLGRVSGWAIKDIRTSYDPKTDTLSVGFETFTNAKGVKSVFGDADGNGDPGYTGPQMIAAGGVNDPHLGGHKSVAIAFAADSTTLKGAPGTPIIVAGVPADKTTAGPGLDGFSVSSYTNPSLGLGYNFGKNLTANQGTLAYDPSKAHPDLEFTIKNFSTIKGIDPFSGLWIKAYAGSPDDRVVGEAALGFTRVPAFSPESIPEPATLLAWTCIAGAGALHLRRRVKVQGRPAQ